MPYCLIGLGSNQGNRQRIIEDLLAKLRRSPQIRVVGVSSMRETAPVGGPAGQAAYLNAAALLDSSLRPEALLALLQQFENEAGRLRKETWGPRTLDLDLLLYGDLVLATPTLTLPHPRMAWRRFVLEPAAEVAGEMLHPVIGWSVAGLLEHLNTAMPYVAVAGPIAAGKTRLARLLCEKTSARLISEAIDEKSLEIFYADPAGNARATEIEFIRRRKDLLAAGKFDWRLPAVSDFWYDQSAAFARVWLAEAEQPSFFALWQEARQKVVKPKLIVLLDSPAETLADRIRQRGRRCERYLNLEQVDRIRRFILDQASQQGLGPVLKTSGADIESALTETLAAMQAMQ
jgi:2-amino-4-hydroxy-6-hydroxymethyldihydropteridine diphosphokinase